MGVSGSGKTSIAATLAKQLQWAFLDADVLHPVSNVEKMAGGTPLTDEDRRPWLAEIATWIDSQRRAGRHGIVACSALKKRYRDIIIGGRQDVRLVYLKGSAELIRRRWSQRTGHFMPAALLDSQFETLEEPGAEEHPIVVSIDAEPRAITSQILAKLS